MNMKICQVEIDYQESKIFILVLFYFKNKGQY